MSVSSSTGLKKRKNDVSHRNDGEGEIASERDTYEKRLAIRTIPDLQISKSRVLNSMIKSVEERVGFLFVETLAETLRSVRTSQLQKSKKRLKGSQTNVSNNKNNLMRFTIVRVAIVGQAN